MKRRLILALCVTLSGAADIFAEPSPPAVPAVSQAAPPIVPLFDEETPLEPATVVDTADALITRIADRVRDRHAREGNFKAYDHYLAFYWEERTVTLEIVDRVARGGNDITINITSLTPLNSPNFRAFFRGINTVAEYNLNTVAKETSPNHYTTTIKSNVSEHRPLQVGDRMEFEFSPFMVAPKNGRKNYYGTTMLYVVGKGIIPWEGVGPKLDSSPVAESGWLGGALTLPYQYSQEPKERFKQIAANLSPTGAQPFMLGRRLHHTDFGNGTHSEKGNPVYEEQKGKLGPMFVARSCVDCHVNNGRALPPEIGGTMFQSVVKVGSDAVGTPHPKLGSALRPRSTSGAADASVTISGYSTIDGKFADGTPYSLRKPIYAFKGVTPEFHSIRVAPQLVGMGLLEAVDEKTILALADSSEAGREGFGGRVQTVRDPETGATRLGRFGYKGGQPRLSHQVAHALNSDMGVTTSIFPRLDGSGASTGAASTPELAKPDLDNMVRYVSTLGIPARRDLADADALRGEKLFVAANCAKCHVPELKTSAFHQLAELRSQTIHPYTDLLLHDMGPELADNLKEAAASGAEWRTAPLWGIGLTAGVSGGEAYLHDGRARTLEEAILWHGGQGGKSRDAFRAMTAADRAALIKFLKSL
jgi:CxxC motif-containing protein (DUF1111 family)